MYEILYNDEHVDFNLMPINSQLYVITVGSMNNGWTRLLRHVGPNSLIERQLYV